MKHTPKNLPYHELIGLRVRIVTHSDPSLVGRYGTVVWETAKTLIIKEPSGREITVLKHDGVFEFELPSGEHVVVEGLRILGRPDNRVKKLK